MTAFWAISSRTCGQMLRRAARFWFAKTASFAKSRTYEDTNCRLLRCSWKSILLNYSVMWLKYLEGLGAFPVFVAIGWFGPQLFKTYTLVIYFHTHERRTWNSSLRADWIILAKKLPKFWNLTFALDWIVSELVYVSPARPTDSTVVLFEIESGDFRALSSVATCNCFLLELKELIFCRHSHVEKFYRRFSSNNYLWSKTLKTIIYLAHHKRLQHYITQYRNNGKSPVHQPPV